MEGMCSLDLIGKEGQRRKTTLASNQLCMKPAIPSLENLPSRYENHSSNLNMLMLLPSYDTLACAGHVREKFTDQAAVISTQPDT